LFGIRAIAGICIGKPDRQQQAAQQDDKNEQLQLADIDRLHAQASSPDGLILSTASARGCDAGHPRQ
jgi:hypothetical protein